jgi:glyoxylase-like metal-dependent hydrolase (beta-lactamase superfamily II)
VTNLLGSARHKACDFFPVRAFPGGVGNTQKDAARFQSLINDVEQRIFDVLADETWVYPGHGNDTTLGAERPHLGEWRARGW